MSERLSTMTVPELAVRVGVDASTAYRYLRAGTLPGVRVGASWLIDRARVERFMAGHEDAVGRPLVSPVLTMPAATLTVLPEPAQNDAAVALRWLQGLHAVLGLLVASAGEGRNQEGNRVTG